MTVLCLKDNWTLTVLGENVYNIPNAPIETKVPSTVYGTLLERGLMPDPYYRDNELAATRLMENDFAYETTFTLDSEDREADRLFLRFDGIDTLADVYLDGELLGTAYNMNRVWEYDITARVKDDEADRVYHLKVVLHSPTRYISQENEKCPVGGSTDAMPGFSHLRKAACMFGWDWGPRLPDAGLFREVTVQRVKTARIAQVYITQQHEIAERTARGNRVSSVRLTADAEIEWMPEAGDALLKLAVYVTGPDGILLSAESETVSAAADSAPSGNLTGLYFLYLPLLTNVMSIPPVQATTCRSFLPHRDKNYTDTKTSLRSFRSSYLFRGPVEELARIHVGTQTGRTAEIRARRQVERSARIPARRWVEWPVRIRARRQAEGSARIPARRWLEWPVRILARRQAERSARIPASTQAEQRTLLTSGRSASACAP